MKLRRYQWQHIRRLTRYLMKSKVVGYLAATGAGKSTVVPVLVDRLNRADKFGTFLFLVPQTHLKEKTLIHGGEVWEVSSEVTELPSWVPAITTPFWKEYKDVSDLGREGFLTACFNALTQPKALASIMDWVATLPEDALDRLLIFVDEGHHRGGHEGNALARLIKALMGKGAAFMPITATGFRTDGLEVVDLTTHPCVIRSLSEQVADGLAPGDWRFETVAVEDLPYDNPNWEQMLATAKVVHAAWKAEGRPISILVVPTADGNSLLWQQALVEVFREDLKLTTGKEDPILQAVGVGKDIGQEVFRRLELEAKLLYGGKHFDELTIGIVISAKRFKEGTDLPSASHIMYLGKPPQTLVDAIQAMGRAVRGKLGFLGYPEHLVNVAKMMFFVPGTPPMDQATRKTLIKNQLLVVAYLSTFHISLRGIRHTLAKFLDSSTSGRNQPPDPNRVQKTLDKVLAATLTIEELSPEDHADLMLRLGAEAEKAQRKGESFSMARAKKVLIEAAQAIHLDPKIVDDLVFAMLPKQAQEQVMTTLLTADEHYSSVLDAYLRDHQTELDTKFTFSGGAGGLVGFTAALTRVDADQVAATLMEASTTDHLSDADILAILEFNAKPGKRVADTDDLIEVPPHLKAKAPVKMSGRMLRQTLMLRDPMYPLDLLALTKLRPHFRNLAVTRGEILRATAPVTFTEAVSPNVCSLWASGQNPRLFQQRHEFRRLVATTPIQGHTWISLQYGLHRGWFGMPPGLDLGMLADTPIWGDYGAPSEDDIEAMLRQFQDTHGRLPGEADALNDVSPPWPGTSPGDLVWQDILRKRLRRGSTTSGRA